MVMGAILFGRMKEGLLEQLRGGKARRSRRRGGYEGVSVDDEGEQSGSLSAGSPAHSESRDPDCNLILSGCFFSLAASILILFRDHSHGQHTGTSTHCQPAWPLTAGGYLLSMAALSCLSLTLCLFSRRCRGAADICCPVDDRRNVWLQMLNCVLCVFQRRRSEDEEEVEEPQLSGWDRERRHVGSAAAAMLAIVREKEEEESRDRERALRRLREIQAIMQEGSQRDSQQQGKARREPEEEKEQEEAEEEQEEGGRAEAEERKQLVRPANDSSSSSTPSPDSGA